MVRIERGIVESYTLIFHRLVLNIERLSKIFKDLSRFNCPCRDRLKSENYRSTLFPPVPVRLFGSGELLIVYDFNSRKKATMMSIAIIGRVKFNLSVKDNILTEDES